MFINSEDGTMQTVISQIAFTFVDDAAALATGFGRAVRYMAINLLIAARARVWAPVDRLARACDVANVLPARQAPPARSWARSQKATPKSSRNSRFAALNVFATFRSLRDLT
jgi:hypothetical protein